MKFVLLIILKLLTTANSFLLNIAEYEISLLINIKMSAFIGTFLFIAERISCSAELSMKKAIVGTFLLKQREFHAQLSWESKQLTDKWFVHGNPPDDTFRVIMVCRVLMLWGQSVLDVHYYTWSLPVKKVKIVYAGQYPVSILCKSISGRHRPVRVADGPMTDRCRFT